MSVKALKTITKISEELDAIAEAAQRLYGAIENEIEDEIKDAVKQFPTHTRMANTFAKLNEFLTVKPWEKK